MPMTTRHMKVFLSSFFWIVSQSGLATGSPQLLSKKSSKKTSDVPHIREQDQKDDEIGLEDENSENDEFLSYEAYRSRTKWALMADGVGLLNGTTLTGLTIAKYLDKNLLLEGSIVSGDHYGFLGGDGTKQTITIGEGRLRRFVSDTFNVSAGLGWKSHQIASTPNLKNNNYEQIEGISASGSGIIGGLSLGNQVQRDKLTLGCDWIGFYRVIQVLEHQETEVSSADPLAESKRNYLSDFRRGIQGNAWYVFRVHLGLVF